MTIGSSREDFEDRKDPDQGKGQSAGVNADGELEGNSVSPIGDVGNQHWQASFISKPGIDQRGNVFFAAVAMTRMPMIVTDPRQEDNPVVFANGAFLDMSGYSEEEILGKNCRMLQGENTDPAVVAEVRKAVHEQRAVAVDLLNYKKDGTPFWNALFIGPIFSNDGELLYFFASQMDITQRRIGEQAFAQAQKMEAIGQLTAGLAHDFNNLLQVIGGNLEVASKLKQDESAFGAALERAQSGVKKAATLTQQLLAFARKQRLAPEKINLNALIVDFSELLVRTLGKQIDLALDLKPGLPNCLLDKVQFEMALLNVLINARDAMPAGGKVVIGTSILTDAEKLREFRLSGGTYVVICVNDSGTGMSREIVTRSIEPFFSTKKPGTGLGLAMVHGFVQQSRGHLHITSEPGNGTKVRMMFPISEEQTRNDADVTASGAEKEHQKTRTVLLVEDDDEVRHLAQLVLKDLGCTVHATASAEEALKTLERREPIDLLFTDVIMPGGMNGVQLCEIAKNMRPELPILLTTGYMDEFSEKDKQHKFHVLAKPYTQRELAEKINRTFFADART
jgi:PAS domain S-box-containing protein